MDNQKNKKAWVIAADMGYGHQRTAYPLKDIAFGEKIINANSYQGIPKKDREFWHRTKSLYEFVSRIKRIPLAGDFAFNIMDRFQQILAYYPRRDLSGPNFSLRSNLYFIKKNWGKDLIDRFKKNPLPIVTTFFTPAFMAEEMGYPGQIYCVICDADVNRAWVNVDPQKSKIKYFTPCTWAKDRLKMYGVAPENIYLTGYPLPKENIGGEDMSILKDDMRHRLLNLDPKGQYRKMYAPLVNGVLGQMPEKPDHPLTIMFSIGGAGAQKEIALKAVNSLKEKIKAKKLRFIIAVGTRKELEGYFAGTPAYILSGDSVDDYFKVFNETLRETDILWTKPSELSFYAGLGIPIIIASTIGSQEDFNKRWLLHTGAAILQENPKYTDQWLFDFIESGDLAEMAMQGFVEIQKMGTYNIERIVFHE